MWVGRRGRGGEEMGISERGEGDVWGEEISADPQMNSPYSDGQPVHHYQAGAAHTHHAP